MVTWDPERYLGFADERGRPFLDLLSRVDAAAPARVVDLGCGPGNLTRLLATRWPDADVLGVDSSPEMVSAAQAAGVRAERADLREWIDRDERVDVITCNATLQWIPGHLALIPALLDRLTPGGWLAFAVPGNFGEPSHTLRAEIAARAPYAEHLVDVEHPASHEPVDYLQALGDARADVWETTYLHVLTGDDPVFTWVSGTGARPTLQALESAGLREAFEAEFRPALAAAYPPGERGVVLPFRRIFAVAQVS